MKEFDLLIKLKTEGESRLERLKTEISQLSKSAESFFNCDFSSVFSGCDLSSFSAELTKCLTSLRMLQTAELSMMNSSSENLFFSDKERTDYFESEYMRFLSDRGFVSASDHETLQKELSTSYASISCVVDDLEYSLRNLNDEILNIDFSSLKERSQWVRDHDGSHVPTLSPTKKYELISELTRWVERRNFVGALLGVEGERSNVQTQINRKRKELEINYEKHNREGRSAFDGMISLSEMKEYAKNFKQYVDKSRSTEELLWRSRQYDRIVRKINAKERIKSVVEHEREITSLDGLHGKALRFRLELIGLDGVKSKIRSLQEMLSDRENPLSGEERKEVEKLLKSWQGYEKVMKRNSVSVKEAWGHVKGVGSSVEGITDALSGNGRAWERVTGVVDGLIGMWESVKGIIGIVDALTGAVRVQESATISSAAAKQMETTAVVENTDAKSGEAIADATSSGAKLPFPANIAAIAAGVAAVVAALGMIGGAFADGGIVGGSSWRGDRLLVRVNSGEMILNARQQAELFALANGSAMYGGASAVVPQWSGMMSLIGGRPLVQMPDMAVASSPRSVVLKAKGRDLVGVISNERRLTRKRILG